jgi:hypothetical protein
VLGSGVSKVGPEDKHFPFKKFRVSLGVRLKHETGSSNPVAPRVKKRKKKFTILRGHSNIQIVHMNYYEY